MMDFASTCEKDDGEKNRLTFERCQGEIASFGSPGVPFFPFVGSRFPYGNQPKTRATKKLFLQRLFCVSGL